MQPPWVEQRAPVIDEHNPLQTGRMRTRQGPEGQDNSSAEKGSGRRKCMIHDLATINKGLPPHLLWTHDTVFDIKTTVQRGIESSLVAPIPVILVPTLYGKHTTTAESNARRAVECQACGRTPTHMSKLHSAYGPRHTLRRNVIARGTVLPHPFAHTPGPRTLSG